VISDINYIIGAFAGNGDFGFADDNAYASSSSMDYPEYLVVDKDSNVYFSDQFNHVVRVVNGSTNLVRTIAGSRISGYSGDGGQGNFARLKFPTSFSIS
jgi:hypothetical protein